MAADPVAAPSAEAARLVRLHGIGYPDYALLAYIARVEAEREAALEGMEAAWSDTTAAESLVSTLCLLFRWQAARIAWLEREGAPDAI